MMKDVIIKIDQNSMVYKQETVLGISYENLQGKIIFKFLGTFPKGTAYLEYERGTEKGYLQMNQVGEEYQLEIKSSLLKKEGRIYLQLRVTEDANPDGIPVFKSNKFYLEVKEAINATAEIPDEYPKWIDIANEKIKEMDNLNITTERVEDGVDIVLTDKKGVTTRTEVKDGVPGPVGPQGAPGAVKMQVVDTLPETGETDTIYLVKKSNPSEQNLYDEYVYTDTGWEHIGDTSVDLTDYYTKTETDAITGNLENLTTEDKSNLVNAINEVANKGSDVEGNELAIYSLKLNGLASGNNVKSSDLSKIDEMINSLFQKGVKQFILRLTYDDSIGYSNAPYTEFIGYNNSLQIKEDQSPVILYSLSNEDVGNGSIRVNRTFNIYGSWNNGVFETSSARFYSGTTYDLSRFLTSSTALTKTNTSEYTPTSDYNPATKKYVDDNIKAYTAGNNIEISDDNVISSSVNGFIELTDETVILKNLNVGVYKLTSSVKYIEYTTNKTYTTAGYMNCFMFVSDYRGIKTGYLFYNNTITFFDGSTSSVAYGYVEKSIPNILTTYQDATIRGTHTYTTLPKTTLIPTTDDQFVNKKYVDDQVGNINTILATLTTVSEVSK